MKSRLDSEGKADMGTSSSIPSGTPRDSRWSVYSGGGGIRRDVGVDGVVDVEEDVGAREAVKER